MTSSVLIIGGGGREHALADALLRSPEVARVYMTKRNAACAAIAEHAPGGGDYKTLANFCKKQQIKLAVIGPEAPLAEGAADVLRAEGVAVFGPSRKAAKIEYSKIYAKNLMRASNIPAPSFAECENAAQLAQWCREHPPPFVVKADGLAAGKGVYICQSADDAARAGDDIFGGRFGKTRLLAEEYNPGEEASFIVVTDGKTALPLPTARDYKRLADGDNGPNTGGMGVISPSPFWDDNAQHYATDKIITPALRALADDGARFCGFLYAGLVRGEGGELQVLEFNCRMGDPEAQAVLPRLDGDIFPLLLAAANGDLAGCEMPKARGASTCVVLASEGYPDSPKTGDIITVAEPLPQGVRHYHAATKLKDGKVLTDGGRVMSVVAVADTADESRKLAYQAVEGVKFRAMHYRKDIGKR